MAQPFFTIGHSTRPLEAFVALLRDAEVARVVDVRTVPRSRTNPQYNADALPAALAPHRLTYTHLATLGGRRGRESDIAPTVNGFWENQSFHNYADYALSEDFRAGLAALRQMGRTERCAIMCAEAVWWRCHRRIIADHLMAEGEAVFHILAPGEIVPARLTPGARAGTPGTLVYPGEPSLFGD